MSQTGGEKETKVGAKDAFKTETPGWASARSTSAFRALNFELFVRPNKYVMAVGAASFLLCTGYMVYMNFQDSRKGTYTTLNEDGTLTSRPRVSRWE